MNNIQSKSQLDPLPDDFYVGDRILILVNEVKPHAKLPSLSIVILEATENGWKSPDDTYSGYTINDGVAWIAEKDIIGAYNVNRRTTINKH